MFAIRCLREEHFFLGSQPDLEWRFPERVLLRGLRDHDERLVSRNASVSTFILLAPP